MTYSDANEALGVMIEEVDVLFEEMVAVLFRFAEARDLFRSRSGAHAETCDVCHEKHGENCDICPLCEVCE